MNASASFDDIRWLVGPEGAELLAELHRARPSLAAAAERLKRRFPAERVHLALEQIELRRRAANKFPEAERMFFLPETIQQATDAFVARYKARRFPAGSLVADLCCGIGGDLLGLAARGPATAVDSSAAALLVAEANVRNLLLPKHEARGWEFCREEVELFPVGRFAAWHMDPDRRQGGRRTTHLAGCRPGPATMERLLQECPNGAIKLAPATEAPERWQREAELEWIARDRQCRQQVAWFGNLAEKPGLRRATTLRSRPDRSWTVGTLVGEADLRLPVADRVGRYVFDPDPAVFAARLVGQLARQHDLNAVHPAACYLTGDRPIDEPCMQGFEVAEVLPFDRKRLRGLLRQRGIGRLEIKVRGVDEDPERIRRDLRLQGSGEAVLLVARACRQVMAILARRTGTLPSPSNDA